MSQTDDSLIVVVTRSIKPGCEQAFEAAMKEFIAIAWTFPGHLGMQMLRPAEGGAHGEYTVLARFNSLETRRVFTNSPIYREWMEKLGEQSVRAPDVRELSGVEGWFALAGQPGSPPKWKMAITVWVGVFIISQTAYGLLEPLTVPWPRWVRGAVVSAAVVAALTWGVLPVAARVLKGWYFPKGGS